MKLRLLENNFSRRVSNKRRTTACFVQWNGGWALEEFKRSGWVNEPWMLNSACSNYRSLPINQLVTTWTAQYMSMSNTAPPPAVSLLSTARWLASPYKYVQTRLKRHRFMRYFVYNVRYSAVRINFSLLTTKLHSSFRTTPVYNDTKYSVPFMTLQLYIWRVSVQAVSAYFWFKEMCVYSAQYAYDFDDMMMMINNHSPWMYRHSGQLRDIQDVPDSQSPTRLPWRMTYVILFNTSRQCRVGTVSYSRERSWPEQRGWSPLTL